MMIRQKLIAFDMKAAEEVKAPSANDLIFAAEAKVPVKAADVRLAGLPAAVPVIERAEEQGTLAAMLRAHFNKAWQIEVGTEDDCKLTLAGSTIYVGGDKGVLKAIAAIDGQPVWDVRDTAPEIHVSTFSRPIIRDGLLFVGAWQSFDASDSSNESFVYVFNARTGKKLWQHKTESMQVGVELQLADKLLFAAMADGRIHALYADKLRAKPGIKIRTRYDVYVQPEGVPEFTVVDGTLYYRGTHGGSYLKAMDANKPLKEHWRFCTGPPDEVVKPSIMAGPVARDGVVYVGQEYPAKLYAIHAGKEGVVLRGKGPATYKLKSFAGVKWTAEFGDSQRNKTVDTIRFLSERELLVGLYGTNLEREEFVLDVETGSFIKNPSPAAAAALKIRAEKNVVVARDILSNKVLWKHVADWDVIDMVIENNMIYFSTKNDGKIYAIEAETGEDYRGNLVCQKAIAAWSSPDKLIPQLKSTDPIERRIAVEIAGQRFMQDAFIPLILAQMLQLEPDPDVKKALQKVLANAT